MTLAHNRLIRQQRSVESPLNAYDGWTAPLIVDGAINGATFKAYVEQSLAPACVLATWW